MLDHCRAISFIALAGALVTSTAAHANAPAGRYVLGSDPYTDGEALAIATVYDTKTKLTWEQGIDFPEGCTGLTRETFVAGWRLPTLKELFTLFDFTTSHGENAPIDDQFFPNTPGESFLSSTSSPLNPVQCVDFEEKYPTISSCGATVHARCVR